MGTFRLLKSKPSLRFKLFIFLVTVSTTYTYISPMHNNASPLSMRVVEAKKHFVDSRHTSNNESNKGINNKDERAFDKGTVTHASDGQNVKVCHIGFLKVHKAGSSTMQNILFRFGLKHNLTFVLPEKNNYILPHVGLLPVRPGGHYDILAIHANYSKPMFDNLLPRDSVNIGIVREPLGRAVSAAYYYRYKFHVKSLKKIPEKDFIRSLINKPEVYDKAPFSHTRNAMGRDFGFSPNITERDVTIIQEHLDLLKTEFRLVLVMERFEESLVLMKRYLNWELSDILFVRINRNSHSYVDLPTLNMNTFRRTNFLDYIIYDTFFKIFAEQVAREGSDFQKEVGHLKSILNQSYMFCVMIKKANKLVIPHSKWNKEFVIFKKDCDIMRMSENEMIAGLRWRHNEMNS